MPSLAEPIVPDGRLRALAQPTLDADGLLVRPWQLADASAVFDAYQDPAIQHWHVRSMADVAEASQWVESWPHRWHAETGADWAVSIDAELVGRVGLKRLDLWDGIGELAYWVVPSARGRGVATRAVDALCGWAFEVLGLHRLELIHATQNLASCRVAEQAGFRAEGTLRRQGHHTDGWHDMHLHGRLAH